MSTLHTVNRSPWERRALEDCLRRVRPGGAVLMIEDGVLGALAGTRFADLLAGAAASSVELFALAPDVAARGIEPGRLDGCVELVDYGGFVDLACRFDRIVSWT